MGVEFYLDTHFEIELKMPECCLRTTVFFDGKKVHDLVFQTFVVLVLTYHIALFLSPNDCMIP